MEIPEVRNIAPALFLPFTVFFFQFVFVLPVTVTIKINLQIQTFSQPFNT